MTPTIKQSYTVENCGKVFKTLCSNQTTLNREEVKNQRPADIPKICTLCSKKVKNSGAPEKDIYSR